MIDKSNCWIEGSIKKGNGRDKVFIKGDTRAADESQYVSQCLPSSSVSSINVTDLGFMSHLQPAMFRGEDLWTIHCSLGLGSSDMQAVTPLTCPGVSGVASLTLRLLLHALPVSPCSAFRAKEALGHLSLHQ